MITKLEKELGLTDEFYAEKKANDRRLARLRRDLAAVKNLAPLSDRSEYCGDCRKYHKPPTWPNCMERGNG